MKCQDYDHNGLARGSYNGPTHEIEQYTMADALGSLYPLQIEQLPQARPRRLTASELQDWHSDGSDSVSEANAYSVSTAEFNISTPASSVTIDLRAEVAQREPVHPDSAKLSREFFDVSGCGSLITVACVFVAKSLSDEALLSGGVTNVSTRRSSINLPAMSLAQKEFDFLLPSWQAARPFGQPVLLRAKPNRTAAEYDGLEGADFSGGLYITGSMYNLAETAVAQAVVLGRILDDPTLAEQSVVHAYGGSLEALHEVWNRALPESFSPTEAAEMAYLLLN